MKSAATLHLGTNLHYVTVQHRVHFKLTTYSKEIYMERVNLRHIAPRWQQMQPYACPYVYVAIWDTSLRIHTLNGARIEYYATLI